MTGIAHGACHIDVRGFFGVGAKRAGGGRSSPDGDDFGLCLGLGPGLGLWVAIRKSGVWFTWALRGPVVRGDGAWQHMSTKGTASSRPPRGKKVLPRVLALVLLVGEGVGRVKGRRYLAGEYLW